MRTGHDWGKTVMLVIALTAGVGITPPDGARADEAAKEDSAPRVVAITAKRFEFVPKQITLKQGEPVTLRLTSEDVTHGFFMRTLGIDAVIEPGQPTDVTITPRTTGTFTTICDHFCGEGHGNMHMTIVVE